MITVQPPVPEGMDKKTVNETWSHLAEHVELINFIAQNLNPVDILILSAFLSAAVEVQATDKKIAEMFNAVRHMFMLQYPFMLEMAKQHGDVNGDVPEEPGAFTMILPKVTDSSNPDPGEVITNLVS